MIITSYDRMLRSTKTSVALFSTSIMELPAHKNRERKENKLLKLLLA